MIEEECSPRFLNAPGLLVAQGNWWMCERILARFYLALHRRSGRYPLVVQDCCDNLLQRERGMRVYDK
jgi:hypothetical protein